MSVRGLREEVPRGDVRRPGRNRLPHQSVSRHHKMVEGPWLLCSFFFLCIPARAPDLVKQDAAPDLTSHKIQSMRMANDEIISRQFSPGSDRPMSVSYQVHSRGVVAMEPAILEAAWNMQPNLFCLGERHLNLGIQLSRDVCESSSTVWPWVVPRTEDKAARL